jgi:hypothetical protein
MYLQGLDVRYPVSVAVPRRYIYTLCRYIAGVRIGTVYLFRQFRQTAALRVISYRVVGDNDISLNTEFREISSLFREITGNVSVSRNFRETEFRWMP